MQSICSGRGLLSVSEASIGRPPPSRPRSARVRGRGVLGRSGEGRPRARAPAAEGASRVARRRQDERGERGPAPPWSGALLVGGGDTSRCFSGLAKATGKLVIRALVRWPATLAVGGRRPHQHPPRLASQGPQVRAGGAGWRGCATCPARARHVRRERPRAHTRANGAERSGGMLKSWVCLPVCADSESARPPRSTRRLRGRARGACRAAAARAANAGRGARGAAPTARAGDRQRSMVGAPTWLTDAAVPCVEESARCSAGCSRCVARGGSAPPSRCCRALAACRRVASSRPAPSRPPTRRRGERGGRASWHVRVGHARRRPRCGLGLADADAERDGCGGGAREERRCVPTGRGRNGRTRRAQGEGDGDGGRRR